ncbi:serine/threonine-protein kinase [Rhizohabitans arisaemae]|uniref:serine/threonine-protein kinase n=1 Tax=Rhizohabitans arisaemae TaxID=2720610 RepID=UPI0024B1C5C6|nr:serine/threonine-protein kinase [Rhizohabitans arisaemae]
MDSPESPDRVGRYTVSRPLGSGGFATVWLGYDDALESAVAIKILAEEWVDDVDIRDRFLREARFLRRAESTRLVQVYDIGETSGRPYFVMTYADRGTLKDRMADGPHPPQEALRLGIEIARAAEVLHDLGVVHRDIKPSNILFSSVPQGERLMLADLGIAKATTDVSGHTISAGTPRYMAPEQGRPSANLDGRADVHGVGAVVYQLLTGTAPLSAAVRRPPGAIVPGLPEGVDEAVMRALEPEPQDRWPSAGAFADALAEIVDATVATGLPAPPGTPADVGETRQRSAAYTLPHPQDRPRLSGKRRRLVTGLVGAVAAAALTAAAFFILDPAAPGFETVMSDDGLLRVEVPAEWAGQRSGAGWNPGSIGLTDGTGRPAVAVSPALGSLDDPAGTLPALHAGVSRDVGGTAPFNRQDYRACRAEPVREHRRQDFAGVVARFGCPGNVLISEVVWRDSSRGLAVYVWIRQPRGADLTTRILDSIVVVQA